MKPAPEAISRIGFFVLLLGALILAASGHLEYLVDKSGVALLRQSNERYLTDAFDRSLKGFLALSVIKSSVAVLEGSEVGIGFNLQVGDITQSVYDYVDVAWKTALAGGTILLLIQLILQSIQLIDHWCLFGLVLAAMISYLLHWRFPEKERLGGIIKEILLFLSVLTTVLYLVLPLSIAGAAFLSGKITVPLVEEAHDGFENLQNRLSPHALNERFLQNQPDKQGLWSGLDLRARLQESKDTLVRMAGYFKEVTRDFAVWTIKIIAGYLFDCIVFPLAFFVVGYILFKNILAYVIGLRRNNVNARNLRATLLKAPRNTSSQ